MAIMNALSSTVIINNKYLFDRLIHDPHWSSDDINQAIAVASANGRLYYLNCLLRDKRGNVSADNHFALKEAWEYKQWLAVIRLTIKRFLMI